MVLPLRNTFYLGFHGRRIKLRAIAARREKGVVFRGVAREGVSCQRIPARRGKEWLVAAKRPFFLPYLTWHTRGVSLSGKTGVASMAARSPGTPPSSRAL